MATVETPSRPGGVSRARKSTGAAARPAKAAKKSPAKTAKSPAKAAKSPTKAAKSPAKPATRPAGARSGVTVPLVNVRVPVLRAHVPGGDMARQQTVWAAQAVRSYLPPMDRMLYYGGVGVAAVVGALEWPVAVAAGAGVWVASRARRQTSRVTGE